MLATRTARRGFTARRNYARAALAAVAFAASAAPLTAAFAAFPNCQVPLTTPNPALMPDANGNYPSDPALPYAGTHTVWSVVNGLQIQRVYGTKKTVPFIVEGVNYEPTQIGGAASIPPFNDYFYSSDTNVWSPLWDRDVNTLRAMGVNAIRTYGMWKFEPGFATAVPGNDPTGTAQFWPQLDFKASATQKNDQQFCWPGDNSAYAFEHRSHTAFLDALWNGGKSPIYIWIGISVPLQLVDENTPPDQRAEYLQYYRYTTKWLAKMYGNHPAVMGFVVGNEIDTAATTKTKLFWDTINDLGRIVKASAPDKLTMAVFHDTPDFEAVVQDAPGQPKGPQIYDLDAYGFNPYTNPAPQGNLFSRFRSAVVECKRPDSTSCVKPLLFGEFGVPADAHMSDPKLSNTTYPVQWTGVNFIWSQTPPPAQCLASDQLGPPPGPGGLGPDAEAAAGATIGVEMPAAAPGTYDMPVALSKRFPGYPAGTALGGANQADWEAFFLAVAAQYRVDPTAKPSALKFNSGGFVFEWRDEWWKGNEKVPYFHSISGHDHCAAGCPGSCDTGAANPVFPGGWGDEEWFGVTGAAPYKRAASAPVVNQYGYLNGGPDTLEPRAAVVAICKAYSGGACP